MSLHEMSARDLGPSAERVAFMRKVALGTFLGLAAVGAIAVASALTVVPAVLQAGGWIAALVGVLGTFLIAQYVCRRMVYGSMKIPGFLLAVACEGVSFGFLLSSVIWQMGLRNAESLIVECMAITAAAAFGMLLYAWFNRGELKIVRAGLAMLGLPMLVLMAFSFIFPVGGVFGLIIGGVFVVVSGAGLLYRLNRVVNELDSGATVEGAYELTMAVLVLLWNVIQVGRSLRR